MKGKIKKIISLLLMAVMLSFSGCFLEGALVGGNAKEFEQVEKDGYTYCYYNGLYHIIGDKKENNSEKWYVEPYLDGVEVKFFGAKVNYGWQGWGTYVPSLQNVKELYLPYNMLVLKSLEINKTSVPELPQKVFLVNNCITDDNYYGTNGFWLFSSYQYVQKEPLREIYLTPIGYDYRIDDIYAEYPWTVGTQEYANGEYDFYLENTHYFDWFIKICKANTSYMFNYEGSPNDDYFFIRDYEYGEKIENAPYEPMRKGYTFGGWYKEAECINAWDFEMDTLPETLYNENDEEVYQETKLYAKWIEK